MTPAGRPCAAQKKTGPPEGGPADQTGSRWLTESTPQGGPGCREPGVDALVQLRKIVPRNDVPLASGAAGASGAASVGTPSEMITPSPPQSPPGQPPSIITSPPPQLSQPVAMVAHGSQAGAGVPQQLGSPWQR
jgi:hypothetical protein